MVEGGYSAKVNKRLLSHFLAVRTLSLFLLHVGRCRKILRKIGI